MFANPNGPSVALVALAVRRLPLVLLLREPIQRAFSAYLMTMANLAKKGQVRCFASTAAYEWRCGVSGSHVRTSGSLQPV